MQFECKAGIVLEVQQNWFRGLMHELHVVVIMSQAAQEFHEGHEGHGPRALAIWPCAPVNTALNTGIFCGNKMRLL